MPEKAVRRAAEMDGCNGWGRVGFETACHLGRAGACHSGPMGKECGDAASENGSVGRRCGLLECVNGEAFDLSGQIRRGVA